MSTPDPDARIDAAALAAVLPVTSSQLRQWAHRGRVSEPVKDRRGRNLYRFGDVVELALAADVDEDLAA